MYTKPVVATTVKRLAYDLNGTYKSIERDIIDNAVDETIANGTSKFKNQINRIVHLDYKDELFHLDDKSLGRQLTFHVPPEYANLTRNPCLSKYLNVDPNKHPMLNELSQGKPKNRTVTPISAKELIKDIESYFEISEEDIIVALKTLLTQDVIILKKEKATVPTIKKEKNNVIVFKKEKDKIVKKTLKDIEKIEDTYKFEVGDVSYPAIRVERTSLTKTKRKFTIYRLDSPLINDISKF